MTTPAMPTERRFRRVRFTGDPRRKNLCYGIIAEDWRYKFLEDVVKPGDEGDLLVEGDPPFEVTDGWVLVKVGEGPGALEPEETVGYWVPIDPACIEVVQ